MSLGKSFQNLTFLMKNDCLEQFSLVDFDIKFLRMICPCRFSSSEFQKIIKVNMIIIKDNLLTFD